MSEDRFEEFFKTQCDDTWKDTERGEITHPYVYLSHPSLEHPEIPNAYENTLASLLLPKSLWRSMTATLVRDLNAEMYVVVTEMWVSNDIEAHKLGLHASDDPKAMEAVFVFGYHKDGREKTDYRFVDKQRKLHPEIRPFPPEEYVYMPIGNVFYPERDKQRQEAVWKMAKAFMVGGKAK
jgi:hypothetical protein